MKLRGQGLALGGGIFACCSTLRPFVCIFRQAPDGKSWFKVRETSVAAPTPNPMWPPIRIKAQELCNVNYDMPLKFEVYSYNENGNHTLLGSFQSTANLISVERKLNHVLPNNKGQIVFEHFNI